MGKAARGLMLATAVLFAGATGAFAGKANDTFVWATSTDMGSPDLYYGNQREVLIIAYAQCDSLIHRDPVSNAYKPLLAETCCCSQARNVCPLIAPARCATIARFWNRISVGMLRMLYRAARSGAAWVSTLRMRTSGSSSPGGPGKNRCHGTAGAAPFGPKVHKHRNSVLPEVSIEAVCGDRDGRTREQALMAASALCLARGFVCRNAVHAVAMRADNVTVRCRHGWSPRWSMEYAGGIAVRPDDCQ